MCGRFAVTVSPSMIADHFNLAESVEFSPNYNITPSQQIPAVWLREGERVVSLMRWGLIPHWAKDEKIGYKMINARAETLFEKPAFRAASKMRRCLIPANGFFEWQRAGKQKQPFYVTVRDQELFSFAGLWEIWQKSRDEQVISCSIITTEANTLMAPIHNRMPAIISPDKYGKWMSLDAATEDLKNLLLPFAAKKMKAYPVSQAVNNPRNNSPDIIAPLVVT